MRHDPWLLLQDAAERIRGPLLAHEVLLMCRGVRACPLGADGDIQWNVISRVLLPHRCADGLVMDAVQQHVTLHRPGILWHARSTPTVDPVFCRSAILLAKLWSDLCDQRGGMPELPGTPQCLAMCPMGHHNPSGSVHLGVLPYQRYLDRTL
jgi:hypothetical protein